MAYPQNFVGLQDSVLAKLRLQGTETMPGVSGTNRDRVKDWLNQAYAQAAAETQALQEAGFATLTANSGTYTLPSHVLELKWVIAKGVSDSAYGAPLRRVSIDEVLNWRQSNLGTTPTNGTVSAYALIGLNQLELYPTPTNADTIQFYYSYLPTALSADGDIPAFQEPWGSKILEYGALAQGAEMQADPLLQVWQASYQDWKQRLRVHMNRRGGMTDQFPIWHGRPVPRDPGVDTGR